VKRSAGDAADVPPGPVTVTSTAPAGPAGTVTERAVSESTVKEAGVSPNATQLAPVKPVPVTASTGPPRVLPAVRLSPVTTGAGAT
jgi:hypothetical protein